MIRQLVVSIVLFVALDSVVHSEVLIWDFVMDEQQVKNGPELDGSTNSPGIGTGRIEYDTTTNMIDYTLSWEGLIGSVTKLHIHGPASADQSNPQHVLEIFGPPDIADFPTETTATWTDSHPLESLLQPNGDLLTTEEILQIMNDGRAYVNVHTRVFGTGESRGNLGIPVPEPSAVGLLATSLATMLFVRRRRID